MPAKALLTVGLGLGVSPGYLLTAGLGGYASDGDTPPQAKRDRQILKQLGKLLQEADGYHEVATTGTPEAAGRSAEHYRKISLDIAGWSEESRWSEGGGAITLLRNVDFTLTIHVRDADPDARDDEADRLYCLAANVINHQSFDAWLVPGMTWLSRARYLPTDGTERRIQCSGRFTYLVTSGDGRTTTEDYPL